MRATSYASDMLCYSKHLRGMGAALWEINKLLIDHVAKSLTHCSPRPFGKTIAIMVVSGT